MANPDNYKGAYNGDEPEVQGERKSVQILKGYNNANS